MGEIFFFGQSMGEINKGFKEDYFVTCIVFVSEEEDEKAITERTPNGHEFWRGDEEEHG